jgi:hypothetical protein
MKGKGEKGKGERGGECRRALPLTFSLYPFPLTLFPFFSFF